MTAVKVPHVHAEVIKAWADGAQIQFQYYATKEWGDDNSPKFHVERQYRVKPERAYPVTQMTMTDFNAALAGGNGCVEARQAVAIANAALRHAIDAKDIIAMADHQAAINRFGERLRDAEIARNAGRDMAIAGSIFYACYRLACDNCASTTAHQMLNLDLAAIIAKVAK